MNSYISVSVVPSPSSSLSSFFNKLEYYTNATSKSLRAAEFGIFHIWSALHLSAVEIRQLRVTRTLWNLREIRSSMSQQDIELVLVANSSKSVPVLHAHARTFPGSESDVFDIDVIDKGAVLFHTMAVERGTKSVRIFARRIFAE